MAVNDTSPGEQLSAEVVQILSGVSEHGGQHLAEIERDLVQMDVLLDEAIKKLCASFMAIHHAADQQQEALSSLQAGDMQPADYAARFEALHAEISQHVGAAVTGLQFQDMTSQLIGRMSRHLAGLRDVFGALEISGPVPESREADLLAVLVHISNRVTTRFAELEGVVRSTVNQRHMESGEIELF